MTSPAATAEPTSRSRAFAVLIMLFLFQTLNFFDKLVFGLSAVPMMKELALTPQQFGLIGSSFFLLFSLSRHGSRAGRDRPLSDQVDPDPACGGMVGDADPGVLHQFRRRARGLSHHPRRRRRPRPADRAARLLQLVCRRQAQRTERSGAAGHQRRPAARRAVPDLRHRQPLAGAPVSWSAACSAWHGSCCGR